MKFLRNYFYKSKNGVLSFFSRIKISMLTDGDYRLRYAIPYVCQYASREKADFFGKSDENLREDANWKDSGASDINEYIFWAPKLCGMACFKMMLSALGSPISRLPLVALGKKAMEEGCYLGNKNDRKRLIGMLHAPFLRFANKLGLKGKLVWFISPAAIVPEILKNRFVMASVSSRIGSPGARPAEKSGHLVLVHGFKTEKGKLIGFYIHNPSNENRFAAIADFEACFSGRIIVLWT